MQPPNALDTAIEMAKNQQALYSLFVVSTTTGIAFPEGVAVVDMAYYDLQNQPRKTLIHSQPTSSKSMVLIVSLWWFQGRYVRAVVEEANNHKIDLIVMGTHGVSGLREFFIGSNAYAVIKLAECPVLTIPPHKKWEGFKKILFPVRPVASALSKYEYARKIIQKSNAELIVMGLLEYDSKHNFETLTEDTKT
ncbi:MAG: universal stress protein [Spirosomataceae bacterium]